MQTVSDSLDRVEYITYRRAKVALQRECFFRLQKLRLSNCFKAWFTISTHSSCYFTMIDA